MSAHRMPFGAELRDDGTARFRLWAPNARMVALELADRQLVMDLLPAGWFEVTAPAKAGTRYRYRIDDRLSVPDPASRWQPDNAEGPSAVVDPEVFAWTDQSWPGRPWIEAVICELHVGTFSEAGTFRGAIEKLPLLAETGFTAIELMPVGEFAGRRNWGYDGVLPFAPESVYGTPDDLKALVDRAHALGLMVLLDVVYNHFGPVGNYLHAYAEPFFTRRHATPWGPAIDFEGPDSHPVRSFFVHNALYWLQEFHVDGLRLDAVHAIADGSGTHILDVIADEARALAGPARPVHLVLENDGNQAHWLARDAAGRPRRYTAQWNDDLHHAAHVALTGETDGYYRDHADRPVRRLARCLAEGFDYQGEPSAHRGGGPRGEPSGQLPPDAFVAFLQNHDQIGNRALGDRLAALIPPAALQLATSILLLSPQVPMLFMGEEWASDRPFLFFCDFTGDLAEAVREGRRREFARFRQFADPAAGARIPDPLAPETMARAQLDWAQRDQPAHAAHRTLVRQLLELRRAHVLPLAALGWRTPGTSAPDAPDGTLDVHWTARDGTALVMRANLSAAPTPFVLPRLTTLLWASEAPPGSAWSGVIGLTRP